MALTKKVGLIQNILIAMQILGEEKEICMTGLMEQMYYGNEKANEKATCDPTHVSVHSAFICMLHLANEKGISFQPGTDENFEVDF